MNVSHLLKLPILILILVSFAMTIGCGSSQEQTHSHEDALSKKEYYELRVYRNSEEYQQEDVLAYLKDAAVPALNRQGISPVGVFTSTADTVLDVYMLIPYSSLEQFAQASEKLMADPLHNQAGTVYLDNSDPELKAYDRIHSSLMVAFDSMPKMQVPSLTAGNQNRIFELRSYESYSEKKGLKKIDMFNAGGEVAIFKEIGAEPVFLLRH